MNSQQQDAVRASITETISELDGLREKATQGEWPSDYINDPFISESVKNDAAYSIALHDAYPALRRAAMAGAELAEAAENVCRSIPDGCTHHPLDNNGDGANINCAERLFYRALLRNLEPVTDALSAYRSAIEEKHV